MIETLEGIREIANFKEGMHLCLYDNDNVEDYPPHWHAPIEIIMPIENTYRAVCFRHFRFCTGFRRDYRYCV